MAGEADDALAAAMEMGGLQAMTKMRELAQKATPGPWTRYLWGNCVQIDFGDNYGTRPCIVAWPGFDGNDLSLKQNAANAALIAACSPERILAYEDAVEALKAVLEDVAPRDSTDWTEDSSVASAYRALAALDALGES